jgi:tetratricopeptide (TPR) repeat protein
MPAVKEHSLPHGSFTDHWIRVPGRATRPSAPASGPVARYVAAYYARDRAGPEAAVYQGMGAVVYASLASSAPALRAGADALEGALRGLPAAGAGARPDAQMLLGVAYQQLGRAADALQALERAAAADPTNPEALRALAQAYLQAGRPAGDAARLYERALAVQPALAWMRAEYADLLESEGLTERAAGEYRRALVEQPSLAGAWFNLGALLAGRGRTAEATDALGRAVRLDPALGQALAPLLAVRVRGGGWRECAAWGCRSPRSSSATAGRRRSASMPAPARGAGGGVRQRARGRHTAHPPPRWVGRANAAHRGGLVRWDLRTDAGRLAGGGLYRLWTQGSDPSGRPGRPQLLLFGLAREDGA